MTEAVRTPPTSDLATIAGREPAKSASRQPSSATGKSAPKGDNSTSDSQDRVQSSELAEGVIDLADVIQTHGKVSNAGDKATVDDAFSATIDEIDRSEATTQAVETKSAAAVLPAIGLAALSVGAPIQALVTAPEKGTSDATNVFARQRGGSIALNLAKLNQADTESIDMPNDAPAVEIKSAAATLTVHSRETHWLPTGQATAGNKMVAVAVIQDLGNGPIGQTTVQKAATTPVALSIAAIGPPPPSSTLKSTEPMKVQSAKNATVEALLPSASVDAIVAKGSSDGSGQLTQNRQGDSDPPPSSKTDNSALKVTTATTSSDVGQTPAVAPFAVVDQLRKGVIDALGNGKQAASATPPSLPDRPTAPGYVLRTIELTLAPADLGAVRLKLSLKDNSLAIDAQASKASTAAILHDDRVVLEQKLRDAGYDLATVRISDASASLSAGFTSNPQTGGSPAHARSGDWQQPSAHAGGGGEGQRRGGSGSEQQRHFTETPEQSRTRASDRSESKGIYI